MILEYTDTDTHTDTLYSFVTITIRSRQRRRSLITVLGGNGSALRLEMSLVQWYHLLGCWGFELRPSLFNLPGGRTNSNVSAREKGDQPLVRRALREDHSVHAGRLVGGHSLWLLYLDWSVRHQLGTRMNVLTGTGTTTSSTPPTYFCPHSIPEYRFDMEQKTIFPCIS